MSWWVACMGSALGITVLNMPLPGVCVLFIGGFGEDFFMSMLPGVEGGAVTGIRIEGSWCCDCDNCDWGCGWECSGCYVFFSPYYTQIHRTAFFPLSPILSQGFCTFTISSYWHDPILWPPVLYDIHLVSRYNLSCTIHIYKPLIQLLVVLGEFRFPSTCSGWLRLRMPGQRQRKLVNVVDTFQAQRGDKSRATP